MMKQYRQKFTVDISSGYFFIMKKLFTQYWFSAKLSFAYLSGLDDSPHDFSIPKEEVCYKQQISMYL